MIVIKILVVVLLGILAWAMMSSEAPILAVLGLLLVAVLYLKTGGTGYHDPPDNEP